VNVSDAFSSTARTEMLKSDSSAWRAVIDAASRVDHYYAAKVEHIRRRLDQQDRAEAHQNGLGGAR
jgi:hypothetical protein